MSITKKNIVDSIFLILTKFKISDEFRVDPDWMSMKIDEVRCELIRKEFAATNIISQEWLSDVNLITLYKVNRADNPAINCACDISKTTIPQVLNLNGKQGNQDLGVYSLISGCGNFSYNFYPMSRWNVPPDHTNSLFNFYQRINTQLYVSNIPEKLRLIAILVSPEDSYLINSAPISSGAIATSTVYLVKYGTVIYNSIAYAPGSTFTGVTLVTTFTTTSGKVFLNSQVTAYTDVMPYPASGDMIRQIELEILTKEFNIEKQAIIDVRNDSTDDATKTVTT